jgi:cytochrome c biogenesis protein CcdA
MEVLKTLEHLLPSYSPLTLGVVFLGGILSSASPCVLASVPMVIGVVGGYSEGDRKRTVAYSLAFVVGLSATFTAFGAAAALLGSLFGDIGRFWPLAVGVTAIVMGLSLMGLFRVRIPFAARLQTKRKGMLGALAAGGFFGLAASPCATPVLVVLLTFVAGQGNALFGMLLLFTYALGNCMLILLAGTFAGFVQAMARSRGAAGLAEWSKRLSGLIICLGGGYLLLVKL